MTDDWLRLEHLLRLRVVAGTYRAGASPPRPEREALVASCLAMDGPRVVRRR